MSLVDRCTTHKHRCFMSTWYLVTIQKLLNDNISIPMCFISYQRMYIFLLLLMTNNISKPLFVLKTTNAVWLFYTKNVVVKKTTGWNLYTSNTSNWSTIYFLFVTRKISDVYTKTRIVWNYYMIHIIGKWTMIFMQRNNKHTHIFYM